MRVAGGLGGKVGVAPRLFLKKLVADVLDRVDLHEDFDPRKHYTLTLAESEMSAVERAAAECSFSGRYRSVSEFEQLHPSLQYHVVNTLGWSTLRPTQLAAIAPIHAGSSLPACSPRPQVARRRPRRFQLLSSMLTRGLARDERVSTSARSRHC
jgi:hypothetical protein